jgi:hypothetical protein
MSISDETKGPTRSLEEALANCSPEDFDGHSDFQRLTHEERLDWLFELAEFIRDFKGMAAGR